MTFGFPIFYNGSILFAPAGDLAMDTNCCCEVCCQDVDDHTGTITLTLKEYDIFATLLNTYTISLTWNSTSSRWEGTWTVPAGTHFAFTVGDEHFFQLWCEFSMGAPILYLRDQIISGPSSPADTTYPESSGTPKVCHPLYALFDMGFYVDGIVTK